MSEKFGEINIYFGKFKGDLVKLLSKIKDLVVWNDDIECDLDEVDFDWSEEELEEE